MKKETYIEKVSEKDNFTNLSNELLQTHDLTWAASGLLHYLLSMPSNWRVRLRELFTHTPSGRRATQTAMDELIAARYVVKEQGENKCRDTIYKVFKTPKP